MIPAVEQALKITEGIGPDDACVFFRKAMFQKHEYLALTMAQNYKNIGTTQGYVKANLSLVELDKLLKLGKTFKGLYIDSSHEEIKAFSESYSKTLKRQYYAKAKKCPSKAVLKIIDELESFQFRLPLKKQLNDSSEEEIAAALARAFDPDWWVRQLHNKQDLILESLQIKIGNVHRKAGIYISNNGFNRKYYQWQRNEKILAGLDIVNDLGEVFNLLDIVKTSVANLTNRRNEMMTRIAGCEGFAKDNGHKAVFYTLTAPSKYHAYLAKPCKPNPKYQQFTPNDTQNYFNTVWKRIRAKLKREGIDPYGIRVVEPHHDGTPHWHLLFFIEEEKRLKLEQIIRHYALFEDGDEKGAYQSRVKVENIDPEKGSAVGYIAKYISKNIDGADIDVDLYGHDGKSSAARIRAWASNWNIRQFQFIGSPSVTTWRELRRAANEEHAQKAIKALDSELVNKLIKATDSGDWQAYMTLSGGPNTALKDQPLRAYQVKRNSPNKYGEEINRILGLIFQGSKKIITRLRQWHTIPKITGFETSTNSDWFFDSGGANAPPLEFCQ